jgi:putative component of membrane protein insertase Oxa1/YidC/SpoIIIJ protein YidD
MTNPRVIEVNGVTIECRVDDVLAPAVLRAFAGATPLDAYVDALPIPKGRTWLAGVIRGLRWYRARVSPVLGQRCVFEPSCSRYAELVLRQRRPADAIVAIVHRLRRCRPGRGGIDLP